MASINQTFVVIREIDQDGDDCCEIVGEYSTEQGSDAEAQAFAHANYINNSGGSAVVAVKLPPR